MSPKLKTAFLFGSGMTFVFCTMNVISILKGEDETNLDILGSFEASLLAGLASGIMADFLSNKLNAEKLFGKRQKRPDK